MKIEEKSIVVVFLDPGWADAVGVEHLLGPAKETSPPKAKAFAVRVLEAPDHPGIIVQAIYGDQPEGNEIRLFLPWRAIHAIGWRPNMETAGKKSKFGF
jgi:hypothetical protein